MNTTTTTEQLPAADLFPDMSDGIYQRFRQFHDEFPMVYLLFKKFALQLIAAGNKKIGAKMIVERIRWEYKTGSKDGEGFKINNNYTAHYARLFIKDHPQHKESFDLRELKTI